MDNIRKQSVVVAFRVSDGEIIRKAKAYALKME
jgi:hypothetical protein